MKYFHNARMSPITRSLLGKQVVLHYHPYSKLEHERITQFMKCMLYVAFYFLSYAQALLTCYLIPATKGWGRGRLTTIPGVLSPAFFLEARERILETRLAWEAKIHLQWSRTSERKERRWYHRDDNYLSWPLTISDKNLFLHREWSISSQLMIQEGTFQSIFVLSTSISYQITIR